MQDPSYLYSQIKSQVQHIPSPQFPEKEHLKCPRCDSTNTKFCYYNNYNLSQPRHYCKSCRRYWTKGGVLRNIPVGGGSRKSTKRSTRDAGGAREAAESASKRPASAAAVGSKDKSGGGGCEMVSEASSSSLGLKKGETSDVAHFGSLMDASISALLGSSSGGHLGNYVDGLGCFGSGQNLDPVALVSGNDGNNNGVEFLNVDAIAGENNGVGGDDESWRW